MCGTGRDLSLRRLNVSKPYEVEEDEKSVGGLVKEEEEVYKEVTSLVSVVHRGRK